MVSRLVQKTALTEKPSDLLLKSIPTKVPQDITVKSEKVKQLLLDALAMKVPTNKINDKIVDAISQTDELLQNNGKEKIAQVASSLAKIFLDPVDYASCGNISPFFMKSENAEVFARIPAHVEQFGKYWGRLNTCGEDKHADARTKILRLLEQYPGEMVKLAELGNPNNEYARFNTIEFLGDWVLPIFKDKALLKSFMDLVDAPFAKSSESNFNAYWIISILSTGSWLSKDVSNGNADIFIENPSEFSKSLKHLGDMMPLEDLYSILKDGQLKSDGKNRNGEYSVEIMGTVPNWLSKDQISSLAAHYFKAEGKSITTELSDNSVPLEERKKIAQCLGQISEQLDKDEAKALKTFLKKAQ